MPKLIMTKGLPASGKSTWAKEEVAKGKGKVKRVNKDDLRAMLDGGEWSNDNEDAVLKTRDRVVQNLLHNFYDVIVDDTNLSPRHEARLREIAENYQATFEVKDFTDVPLETCLKRDAKRANYVGEKVITDMWRRYLAPKPPDRGFSPLLPDAYVFDMDGTLARLGDRSPYDQAKCGDDLPNVMLIRTLNRLSGSYDSSRPVAYVLIVSGRWEQYRPQTEAWLDANCVVYDLLYMRPDGDQRKDYLIKQEIFEQKIDGKYNVLGVFDDRPSVIRMWRSLGLPVFDVAGSHEF